jgi:dipeptidyl-peptidase-4
MGPVPGSFNWSPGGARLAYVESKDGQDVLWLYDAATGSKQVILDPASSPDATIDVTSAQWSPKGDAILLSGEQSLWLLQVDSGSLQEIPAGASPKTGLMLSSDGTQLTYVQDNDIYLGQVAGGQAQRLTQDGSEQVFNGCLDWVYNEELATRTAQPAYAWAPDGQQLMYLKLDDTQVQVHSVTDYHPIPPTTSDTRYPAAGSANPQASVHTVSLAGGVPDKTGQVTLPAGAEYVLPFFTWTPDSKEAMFITVNRDHTELNLVAWNPASATARTVIQETDPKWINEDRYMAPLFLGDGSQFLWVSERSGYMHLYLYQRDGTLVRQLTQGDWMIDSSARNLLTPGRPVHVDPAGEWAYFITTQSSPLERQIMRVNIASGKLEQVSKGAGFHFTALSGDGAYLVDQFSNVDTTPITRILKADGSGERLLSQSAGPSVALPKVTREFVTLKAHDGVTLYAQMVKPEGFDPAKKYPVVVHWYGGPGLQMVSNCYGAVNIFNIIERDTLYTQEGFIVWRLDNRGSLGRGHVFETPIQGQLGPAALDDQMAGIEYLRKLSYVDAAHIGTDGKSFGGYMTLYALIHAPETFTCGVAGSGPTRWEYYDTIYTERYMRTPQQNPQGYEATDLVSRAGQIQAAPLLIHGLNDTNVHMQNTVNFIEALEAADRPFNFIPLPGLNHSYHGDGLSAALMASVNYFQGCLRKP